MVGKRWVEMGADGGDVPESTFRIVQVAWSRAEQQKVVWYYDESDPRFAEGFPHIDDASKRNKQIRQLCECMPVSDVKEWLAATDNSYQVGTESDSRGDYSGGSGGEEEADEEEETEERDEEEDEEGGGGGREGEEDAESDTSTTAMMRTMMAALPAEMLLLLAVVLQPGRRGEEEISAAPLAVPMNKL